MSNIPSLLFFFDVDNTLLDNDSIVADLRQHLIENFGREHADNYFEIFEQLRGELGYADYLGALQRYRLAFPHEPKVLLISSFLVDYPFARRLFPGALEVVRHCGRFGPTAILSDGDVVFQPRKIERSGIWQAVDGRVLVYIHKEKELDEVQGKYPAEHYVLVDDKLRILADVKRIWRERVTTVFPRQGHYAHDPRILSEYPPADVSIDCIADLANYSGEALRAKASR